MIRLALFLVAILAAAAGMSWLADRPGTLVLNWQGYEVETTVFRAVVMFAFVLGFAIVAWSIIRGVWQSPAAFGSMMNRRRQSRGLDALSSGMIAIGAGDKAAATRYAVQARKSLPNEPLTHLLRAQAAQLSGDRATSRRIFEAMLAAPDTEQLGLRGLFLEAQREGEDEAARQFAERAVRRNAKLPWAADALFELQCKQRDWAGALETLTTARKNGQIEKRIAERRRAVLLTALAQKADESEPIKAQQLALEAHALAPDLVPAGVIAGRHLAARGNTAKAAKVLQSTWRHSPHPDLAATYAFARPGDSPRDRLERVRALARQTPHSAEGPIALAAAALDAREFDEARRALEPLLDDRLTQRVCTLMARIEVEAAGDKGRAREWLARAVTASPDPAWTADGFVSDQWQPASPSTGRLDAFQWRVPGERLEKEDAVLLAERIDQLVALTAAEAAEVKTIAPQPEPAREIVSTAVTRAAAAAASVAAAARSLTPAEHPSAANGASMPASTPAPAAAPARGPQPEPVVVMPMPSTNGVTAIPQRSPTEQVAAKAVPTVILGGREKPAEPTLILTNGASGATVRFPGPSAEANGAAPARNGGDARYYAPARAPDDPGPDSEAEEPTVSPYRVSGKA